MGTVALQLGWNWRRPERDLFFLWLHLGVISIGICGGCVSTKIRRLKGLESAVKRLLGER